MRVNPLDCSPLLSHFAAHLQLFPSIPSQILSIVVCIVLCHVSLPYISILIFQSSSEAIPSIVAFFLSHFATQLQLFPKRSINIPSCPCRSGIVLCNVPFSYICNLPIFIRNYPSIPSTMLPMVIPRVYHIPHLALFFVSPLFSLSILYRCTSLKVQSTWTRDLQRFIVKDRYEPQL